MSKNTQQAACSAHSSTHSAPGASPDSGLQRAAWLKLLLRIHWISSALCLLGILLFSLTGLTLNHAAQIESVPKVVTQTLVLPELLLAPLRPLGAEPGAKNAPLPDGLATWLADHLAVNAADIPAEWSADEIYLALPRPGGDAWLRVGLDDGTVEYERTDRGWISWLNDLHKGRHSGAVWGWFIDILAMGCLLFSLTGLLILQMHAAQRHTVWPLLGLGVLMPVLIALLFIH